MFTSVSIPCYDFTLEDGDAKRVSVIVAPIKLVEFEDGSLGVSFACSRGAFCHDPHYIPLCQTILNTIDYKTQQWVAQCRHNNNLKKREV